MSNVQLEACNERSYGFDLRLNGYLRFWLVENKDWVGIGITLYGHSIIAIAIASLVSYSYSIIATDPIQ